MKPCPLHLDEEGFLAGVAGSAGVKAFKPDVSQRREDRKANPSIPKRLGISQRTPRPLRGICLGLLLIAATLTLPACTSTQPTPVPQYLLTQGEFGKARVMVRDRQVNNRKDRAYLLDRARVGILTLDDGYAESALTVFDDVYDVLRTQGLNENKKVVAVAINEDLKIWKGEPFEQAVTLAYISLAQASIGSWDNSRAAANNALFYLRDFGQTKEGKNLTPEQLTVAAAQHDKNPKQGVDLDHGYIVQPSNFTLGYYLHAIASHQLDRDDEASDYFRQTVKLQPQLSKDVERFKQSNYDTVLVVSWGVGPRKIGTGPDNAIAAFRPRTPNKAERLMVSLDGDAPSQHAIVTDINQMARDHQWNNLQDVRIAKSHVGSFLVVGGLLVADNALNDDDDDDDDDETAAIAAGAIVLGAILKAGAHADTRFNDVLPQRFYVVPLTLGPGTHTVELSLPGYRSSKLKLTNLTAPAGRDAQLRYIRLPGGPNQTPPQDWATQGQLLYANTFAPPRANQSPSLTLPYLLGGTDTRPPSEEVLDEYQAAGHLKGFTLAQLQDLYRQRKITWTIQDTAGYADRHILEGGTSLVAPLPGTTGYARLFNGQHPPFRNPPLKLDIQPNP